MTEAESQSTLRVERRSFSFATLGPDNPLPMLGAPLENPYQIGGAIPQEIIDGSTYGNPRNLHPYQLQDDYDRRLSPRELRTVVLENDKLRAVFLPELGGRLWQLFDKKHDKELLFAPTTVPFANLALRNAWFAGGIEWNIGTRGHSPTTCSPVHAATVRTTDGQDVLRMWEFDRLREVVFQIDAWLPPDSAVLFLSMRIRNPNAHEVPIYWWSNAAVPEDKASRVIVPADSAFASDYSSGISRVTPTNEGGVDCTWPSRNARARDFFFDLRATERRWIVNADHDGDGLAMLSTHRLRGRKLFVWGQGAGGRHWQEWLSPDGGHYAEIQAGLAQTQFQHLTMPSQSEWCWLEAYGNARVDPRIAHGDDWDAAIAHGGQRVEELLAGPVMDATLEAARGWADLAPAATITHGSGWGAVESALRGRIGLPWLEESGTPFPAASVTDAELPWLDLAEGRGFSGAITFVAGRAWRELLEAEPATAETLLNRAVIEHADGRTDAAAGLYAQSLHQASRAPRDAALAHRGLAMIALADGRTPEGIDHYDRGCGVDPTNSALLVEAATAALAADNAHAALRFILRAAPTGRRVGRIRLLKAMALVRTGEPQRAAAILREGIEVADFREGDDSIAALWREVCPGEDVPVHYEFSMG